MTSYRSCLPVGSGMGLSASELSLRTKPVNLKRSSAYIGHMLTALPSLASAGDEFASEDFASLILSILNKKESTSTPIMQAQALLHIEQGDGEVIRRRRRERPSDTRNGTAQRLRIAHPIFRKDSIIPRRLRYIEDLFNCWRDGNSSRGCMFALRLLQRASDRKRLIPACKNNWWVSLRHKDCLARYKVVMKQVVMMENEKINLVDRGNDSDWEEAVRKFHVKWDDPPGRGHLPNTLSRYLDKF